MKIDEGVNGKIHAKLRQILNSKAKILDFEKETEFAVWWCGATLWVNDPKMAHPVKWWP